MPPDPVGALTYMAVAALAARQQTVYRGEMIARAISMGVFMVVFVALWSAAFSGRADPLAGYSREQMLWYLVMTETIVLSCSRVFLEISEAVRSGDIAYTLVRPAHYALWQIAHSLGGALPRFLTSLAAGSVVVLAFTGTVAGSPVGFLGFVLLASLALVLDAVIAVLIGLAAFWIEDVSPVFWIYQKLLFTIGGMLVPLQFFPQWLQAIASWLPFSLIVYAPAHVFVAGSAFDILRALASQTAYLIGASLLLAFVWSKARNRMVVQGG